MTTLFEAAGLDQGAPRPLADRLRPQSLDDVAGQEHLLGPDGPLRLMLAKGALRSVIFWGPPGTGKTTVARLIAKQAGLHFEQISAIYSGVQELRKLFDAARDRRKMGMGTVLFVDEIHRFNRAQQDSFLPVMEDGTIILIGATTENPSFELNGALLSRATVLVFRRLDDTALWSLLGRAEELEKRPLPLDAEARERLIAMADGDGRTLLNLAESVYGAAEGDHAPLTPEDLVQIVQRRAPLYDKNRDGHYDLISALHKSVRGSDPDAALYWLARMLAGGEDPLYVARRLVRMAIEDIGLADPLALVQANAAKDAYDFPRHAGRRTCPCPDDDLPRDCAEIQPRLCRLRPGDGCGEGARLARPAKTYSQCADPADGRGRLWPWLYLRPRLAGGLFRPGLFPRRDGAAELLSARTERRREGDRQAHGGMDKIAAGEKLNASAAYGLCNPSRCAIGGPEIGFRFSSLRLTSPGAVFAGCDVISANMKTADAYRSAAVCPLLGERATRSAG